MSLRMLCNPSLGIQSQHREESALYVPPILRRLLLEEDQKV
jgi:hypothetical protein